MISDASGSFGCGALSGSEWFQIKWPQSWTSIAITAKELVPIVVAAAIWDGHWSQTRICVHCDNMAVVDLLKSLTSRDTLIMQLLRCLAFYAAYYRFEIESVHVPGVKNIATDAISRNHMTLFASLHPQARRQIIPQQVLDLLIINIPDWGSPAWIRLFKHTLTMALPGPLEQSTPLDGKVCPILQNSIFAYHRILTDYLCRISFLVS